MTDTRSAAVEPLSKTARLLLVDDDLKFCRLTCDYLSRHGFNVSVVHEGAAALEKLAAKSWDAVILDVMLPGIDGYEVLRRVRESSNVPVLMLTALGDDDT